MSNYFNCPCCGSEKIFKQSCSDPTRTIDEATVNVMTWQISEILREKYGFQFIYQDVHDPLSLIVRRMLQTDVLPFVGVGVQEDPEVCHGPDPDLSVDQINTLTRDIEVVLKQSGIEIEHRESMRNLRGAIEYKILRPLDLSVPEYDDQDTFDKPSVLGLS